MIGDMNDKEVVRLNDGIADDNNTDIEDNGFLTQIG